MDDDFEEFLRDKESTGGVVPCRECGNDAEVFDRPAECELIAVCRRCVVYDKVG